MTHVDQGVPDYVLETLQDIFNEMFAPDKVVAVRATGEESWDGDALVKIDIVFEDLPDNELPGKDGPPDMKKAFGIWRRVRPVLEQAGDTRRPYFRYMTKHEMDDELA